MENMTELPLHINVRGCYCSNFGSGLHLAFHRRVYLTMTEVDLKKLHIGAGLMKEWMELIEQGYETDSKTSLRELTQQIAELNERLTELITYIFEMVRVQRKSFDEEKARAAESLYTVVRAYRGLQQMLRYGKSAKIECLLRDFDDKVEAVKRLSLTSAIKELERVNKELDETLSERIKIKKGYTANYKLRPKMDRIYSLVVKHISASYMLAENDSDKQEIIKLVVILNRIIADFRRSYNESMAQKRRVRKPDEDVEPIEEDEDVVSPVLSDDDSEDNNIKENDNE